MAESIVSGLLITASAVARPHSSHSLPHGSCATRVPQLQRDRLCVRPTVDEDEAMSIDNLRLFRRQRRQVEWSLLRALAFLFLMPKVGISISIITAISPHEGSCKLGLGFLAGGRRCNELHLNFVSNDSRDDGVRDVDTTSSWRTAQCI
uniref:Uncharacterized protein n=1 Tax=Oryza sativa subsp. japonica TaxID=39947 RepID=Q6Z9P0_ORYSJ|nr:hypothetical protein [Oryza sativa Japonica Group]